MARKRFRDAYICYYLPANLLKTVFLLEKAWDSTNSWHEKKEFSILDAGCGPGTAGIGTAIFFQSKALEQGWKQFKLRIHSLDSSPEILKENFQLTRNFSHALQKGFPGLVVDQHLHHANLSEGWKALPPALRQNSLDALFFSNVLAEMGAEELPLRKTGENKNPASHEEQGNRGLVHFVHKALLPTGLAFFLEPAQRTYARRLLSLRDTFAEDSNFQILSPCPNILKCPALNLSEKDWCHDRIQWERPGFIASIDRLAGISKESLKFTHLMVSLGTPKENHGDLHRFVVVSEPMKGKGKFMIFLCGVEGRFRFELLKRDLSESNRGFCRLRRGDKIFLSGFTLKNEIKRLDQDSVVRLEL